MKRLFLAVLIVLLLAGLSLADTAIFRVIGGESDDYDWLSLQQEAEQVFCRDEFGIGPDGYGYVYHPSGEDYATFWVRTCPEIMAQIKADPRFELIRDIEEPQ